MVDLKILAAFGSTKERFREVLTSTGVEETPKSKESPQDKKDRIARNEQRKLDAQFRKKFEDLIQSRVIAGITRSLTCSRPYSAVDLAYDSSVLNKINIPLLLYAQGKINVERAVAQLEKTEHGNNYIKKDAKGKAVGIDVPKFVESECNMVRSIVNRRWAAQKNKYGNLWPYYNYESRSTGMVGKLRADLMSQRSDIMVDQFGVRHHDGQVMLDGLLYGHSVDFVRCSWEVDTQLRYSTSGDKTESYVTREGVAWFNPHPSRVFWDASYPLSTLNSDSGCDYVGFWDVVTYGAIENNHDYFNRDRIGFGANFWGTTGLSSTFVNYFNQYDYQLKAPINGDMTEVDIAGMNDRKSVLGLYSMTNRDASMFTTNYFQRLVPKEWGIGDYPHPVWARIIIASDSTPIFAEFLPSLPGCVLSINENDSRSVSVSMAMDVLQYHQHMSNLLTHLMKLLQIEAFKAIGINSDALSADQVTKIEKAMQAENWSEDPLVFRYSLAKLVERLGLTGKISIDPITISEARQGQSISVIFDAMTKLVSLAERMLSMSAAESGQSEPREISATQTNVIAATTQTIYNSVSDAIDEFRETKKRIIYESTVSCSTSEVRLPVKGRYTKETVKAAGFDVVESEDEDITAPAKRRTVTGNSRALVHEYIFSSRDGSERPVNTQAANTLVQLLAQTLAVPDVVQNMGKERLFSLMNEIFRLSGAGFDLNLEFAEGEDKSFGESEIAQLKQEVDQVVQMMNQLAQQSQKNAQEIASQSAINDQQQQHIDLNAQLAEKVKGLAVKLNSIAEDYKAKPVAPPMIPYKDAPASVQKQMELQNGYVPAKDTERAIEV